MLTFIIITLVVAFVVWWKWFRPTGKNTQKTIQLPTDSFKNDVAPTLLPIIPTSADSTSTTIPNSSSYWTIPKEQSENGGWDSIDGFYKDEDLDGKWTESWQNVYE